MTDRHLDSGGEFERWQRPPRTTPAVIDRRVLSNGEVEEWERPATIPDDFIYDPETDSYYAPGEPCTWDLEAWRRRFDKVVEEIAKRPPMPSKKIRLHSRAPDAPASKRKSLGNEPDLPLFRGLVDDDDTLAENHQLDTRDVDGDAPGDERA